MKFKILIEATYAEEVAEANARLAKTKNSINNMWQSLRGSTFYLKESLFPSLDSKATATFGNKLGQVYYNGHRILELGKYKIPIDPEDDLFIQKAYSNTSTISLRFNQDEFFNTVLSHLSNKYHYNIDPIKTDISKGLISLPHSKLDLGRMGGLDSSVSAVRSVPYWAEFLIDFKSGGAITKAGGLVAKGYNWIDRLCSVSFYSSKAYDKTLGTDPEIVSIRNMYLTDPDGKELESDSKIIDQLKQQGIYVEGQTTNIGDFFKKLTEHWKKKDVETMEQVLKGTYINPYDDHDIKPNVPNTISLTTSATNSSSGFGIDNIVDSFLTKFGLKEKLGWFGQSTAHLSVGILGTILVGLGLYKTAKAFKA